MPASTWTTACCNRRKRRGLNARVGQHRLDPGKNVIAIASSAFELRDPGRPVRVAYRRASSTLGKLDGQHRKSHAGRLRLGIPIHACDPIAASGIDENMAVSTVGGASPRSIGRTAARS